MGLFAKIKQSVAASIAGKIAVGAAIVLLLGGGIAGVTYAAVFSGAEAVVTRAAMATFTKQTSATEEAFGFQTLSEALKEQGTELSLQVGIPQLPLGELGLGLDNMTLPEAGLSLNIRVTPERAGNAELSARAANTTLLSGNIYFTPEQLQVNVPKLFEPVLSLNYGSPEFAKQAKDSYAVRQLGLTDAQVEEIAAQLQKQTSSADSEGFEQGLVEIILSNYDTYLGDTELKKADKEELSEGDSVLKCKVYSAEADSSQVEQFFAATHEMVQDYIKEYIAAYDITAEQIEEVFAVSDELAGKMNSDLSGPVTIKFYVCEKRMVQVSVDWMIEQPVDAGSVAEPGSLVISFAKEGNPLENMRLDLHTPIHRDASITDVPQRLDFTCQVITEYTGEEYTVSYSINANAVPYYLEFDYEILSGNFEFTAEGGEESIILTGVAETPEKGSSFGIEVDRYQYQTGEYSEEIDLDVSVFVKVLETEVAPLSGETQDVLAMAESDFKSLGEEIAKNITWMLFSMMGLFQ